MKSLIDIIKSLIIPWEKKIFIKCCSGLCNWVDTCNRAKLLEVTESDRKKYEKCFTIKIHSSDSLALTQRIVQLRKKYDIASIKYSYEDKGGLEKEYEIWISINKQGE